MCVSLFPSSFFYSLFYSPASQDLRWIADQLGHDWKRLGSFLRFEPPEIERLEANYSQVEEQIYQMLVGFRTKSSSATYSGLHKALIECDRKDITDELGKYAIEPHVNIS